MSSDLKASDSYLGHFTWISVPRLEAYEAGVANAVGRSVEGHSLEEIFHGDQSGRLDHAIQLFGRDQRQPHVLHQR